MTKTHVAKFRIGEVTRHRLHATRGVVIDVDAVSRADDGDDPISLQEEMRRNQPFYYLLAENDEMPYVAYVAEQDLLADGSDEPVEHPGMSELFELDEQGNYRRHRKLIH